MNNRIKLRKYSKKTENKQEKQTCYWQGCVQEGQYRAPKSRSRLQDYQWFCMDHIRQFNKSWNYYQDMDDSEVEADKRHDTVWNRPSWKLGSNNSTDEALRQAFYHAEGGYNDPFDVFEDDGPAEKNSKQKENHKEASSPNDRTIYNTPECKRALKIFGLEPPMTKQDIKSRYKYLVKRHHPDANGGDKASEKKIRQINNAYDTLLSLKIT